MNVTQDFVLDSLTEPPIGDTEHFIWYITDIGIVALVKNNEDIKINNSIVEIEANKIALDITKEEKDYLEIDGKKIFLFYS